MDERGQIDYPVADLVQPASAGRNIVAIPAAPIRADRHGALVASNRLAAKAELIFNNSLLFHTVLFS